MNQIDASAAAVQARQDAFGRSVAARLSAGSEQLPHDIGERLRAAREQALEKRRAMAAQPLRPSRLAGAGGVAVLGERTLGLWGRIASVLPVLLLAAGLVGIHIVQNEIRAEQLAEVDAQLLTDDLPPDAYTDPGFAAFLRREQ